MFVVENRETGHFGAPTDSNKFISLFFIRFLGSSVCKKVTIFIENYK